MSDLLGPAIMAARRLERPLFVGKVNLPGRRTREVRLRSDQEPGASDLDIIASDRHRLSQFLTTIRTSILDPARSVEESKHQTWHRKAIRDGPRNPRNGAKKTLFSVEMGPKSTRMGGESSPPTPLCMTNRAGAENPGRTNGPISILAKQPIFFI
jgi:hypothetical protein